MKVGDLVKFCDPLDPRGEMTFLITHMYRWNVSLLGYPENQVFSPNTLKVISPRSDQFNGC